MEQSESGDMEEDIEEDKQVDKVLLRHEKMLKNAGRKEKVKNSTPLSTMYYNDPQYADKIAGIEIAKDSIANASQARIGNNGMLAPDNLSLQSSGSLIQNIRSQGVEEEQTARPATKDDFIIHDVKFSDTLERISIQYDVCKDAIKMANGFLGDEIYMFKTLKVPFTYGEVYHVPHDEKEEEKKREIMKDQFHQIIRDSNLDNQNYGSEVRYYLEMNDYNMERAMKHYEEDLQFEK